MEPGLDPCIGGLKLDSITASKLKASPESGNILYVFGYLNPRRNKHFQVFITIPSMGWKGVGFSLGLWFRVQMWGS